MRHASYWATLAAALAVSLGFLANCGGSSGDDSSSSPGVDSGVIAPTDASLQDSDQTVDASDAASVPRIDVNGTLYGYGFQNNYYTLSGRDVVVIDAEGTVTKTVAGAGGAFSVTGVVPPYDVAIPYLIPDGQLGTFPIYWQGLTRTDPKVAAYDYGISGEAPQTYNATFNFSFVSLPNFKLHLSSGYYGEGTVITTAGSSNYSWTFQWLGSSTSDQRNANVHFYLLVENSLGSLIGYADLGAYNNVAPSSTITAPSFSLTGLTTAPLSVTAKAPSGYTTQGVGQNIVFPDGYEFGYANAGGVTSTTFQVTSTLSSVVWMNGTSPRSEGSAASLVGITSAKTTLEVDEPLAPALLNPTDHASGVTDADQLEWSSIGTPQWASLTVRDMSGYDLTVYSASTSLRLSNLSKAGFGLKPGTSYTWSAGVRGESLDSFADGHNYLDRPSPAFQGYSVQQSFTTQ